MRLAIISTPRSGNTWLRRLLASLYELEERGAATPEDVDWGTLPERCALQIHWHPTEPFRDLLNRHGFRVVVLCRHPLDTMISVLHFMRRAHDPSLCTKPSCFSCPIVGATPLDHAFIEQYARGPGGERLLSFSHSWWDVPGVLRVRYENLVSETGEVLERLAGTLGDPARNPISTAIEANTIGALKSTFPQWDYHFWKGRPGLWRSLIPAAPAHRVAEHHGEVFEAFGYSCDPDHGLTDERALDHWRQLVLADEKPPAVGRVA